MPCCGKSTYREKLLDETENQTVVLSTDDYIESMAKKASVETGYNVVYDDVLSSRTYREANAELKEDLKYAVANDFDIIWDQTNLTIQSRMNRLSAIPDDYEKIAVVAPHPYDISNSTNYQKRLKERSDKEGKTLAPFVIESMFNQYEPIDLDQEDFDQVILIKPKKELENI